GLGHRLNFIPTKLSGGEKQRVAIARALANSPSIILADEPTGNLDSKAGEEILKIFDELHKKEGKTLVVVTHEHYVAQQSEKIIRLKDGKIEEIMKPAKTGERYAYK
ncbi:MAG: ATP-binding cassette domain-containing protein, partial [Candidatus Micrarchaeota archaeon]